MSSQELRQKWVEALRSGKYVQQKRALHSRYNNKDTYCCLGVACHIYCEESEKPENGLIKIKKETHFDHQVLYEGNGSSMPRTVLDAYGFKNANNINESGCVIYKGVKTHLATLNDRHDKTFSEIADIIEMEPKGLFVE